MGSSPTGGAYEILLWKSHLSLRVGFEPTREDPIGFQVQRLNHSAIAAWQAVNWFNNNF